MSRHAAVIIWSVAERQQHWSIRRPFITSHDGMPQDLA